MIGKLKAEFRALRYSLYHRLAFSLKSEQDVMKEFHKLYYDSAVKGKTWDAVDWFGARVNKCPFDLWNYQELLYRLKPDLIIETGTYFGGSAYFFATVCDLIGKGRVISIDIDDVQTTLSRERRSPEKVRPAHPRIEYWQGSSTSPDIIDRLKPIISQSPVVFVNLDSDHRKEHVLNELRLYQQFVTRGSYMIVEDTDINGHPVYPEFGPGPWEAVDEFLKETKDFIVDEAVNTKHLLSLHPNGYLKKIS
jgi:cephalosporin hydroxylase